MENVRLASIWEQSVKSQGWSERAASQLKFSWANSTLKQYDRYIKAFEFFCNENGHEFPPDSGSTGIFADFLCKVADRSERPESLLKMHAAAIACLYEGIGWVNPMKDPYLYRLVTALVKAGTKRPAKRTAVMPIKPFYEYFNKIPSNEDLSLKDLRLKAITLIALTFMVRPSDIAPRTQLFDPVSSKMSPYMLSRHNVMFHSDGSLSLTFFGIKNDTSRSGFEVRVPPSDNVKVDPVSTLKCYIERTDHLTSVNGPVFLSMAKPYLGIKADTVSKILLEAIDRVGLGGMGYKAKCFRPTGANAAIRAGCDPDMTMYVGRWKTKEVFYNHYVHSMPQKGYTDGIMAFEGLNY